MKVTVIDYGLSNLLSVQRAIQHLGHDVLVTSKAEDVTVARTLVLPGVGAFRDGMAGLASLGLIEAIRNSAARGTPLLGICLGMQMLLGQSEEFGLHYGLGLLPGRVTRIPDTGADGSPQRVPQVGWNVLLPPAGAQHFFSPLLAAMLPGSEVYFVHSYEVKPQDSSHVLADTLYGGRRVCAAVGSGNVFGTQFHPEKSGEVGLAILGRYLTFAQSLF